MPFLLRLVSNLPISTETRLTWQRSLLDRAYGKDITAARKLKDNVTVESLVCEHRFEIDLLDEEEDSHLTKNILAKARRLRVPVPHSYNDDKTESEHWYEGQYTCRWCLTTSGFSALREEIRREEKARHEACSHWVVWLSGFTGVIGAVTGLVALLTHKSP